MTDEKTKIYLTALDLVGKNAGNPDAIDVVCDFAERLGVDVIKGTLICPDCENPVGVRDDTCSHCGEGLPESEWLEYRNWK